MDIFVGGGLARANKYSRAILKFDFVKTTRGLYRLQRVNIKNQLIILTVSQASYLKRSNDKTRSA